MAARVKVVKIARRVRQARQIVGHGRTREHAQIFTGRRRVDGIRGMGQNGADSVFSGKCPERGEVFRIKWTGLPAARVAREKLKHVGPDARGPLGHGHVAAGRGYVATYFKHENCPLLLAVDFVNPIFSKDDDALGNKLLAFIKAIQ